MNLWESDKLVIFIAFVIPGFVGIKCYQLLVAGTPRKSSEQLIDAIAYSCLNYALLSPILIWITKAELWNKSLYLYSFLAFLMLFVAPLVWVFAWLWLRKRQFLQEHLPHPVGKPWDFIFSQRKRNWIKLTLKNGEKIAGKYSGKSFASSAPLDEQIYLEETWLLNEKGGFERRKKRSEGVLILSSEIAFLEFLEYEGS